MNKYQTHTINFSHDVNNFDDLIDDLGRKEIAQTIAEELRGGVRPRVIGIYGWWGSGKSHLMSQTIKYLLDGNQNNKQQVIVCVFEAWRYEMEGDLAPGLIKSLMNVEKQVKGRNPTLKNPEVYKNVAKFLLELLSTVGATLGPVGQLAALISKSIQIGIDNVTEYDKALNTTEFMSNVDQIKSQTKKLVNAILDSAYADSSKQYRLVVFIDDLDRCSPENMVRMFEWLKVHLAVDGCTYVMGLDNVAAARAIVGRYREYLGPEKDLAYGFRYLEKLVDSEYELGLPLKAEAMALRHVYGENVQHDRLSEALQAPDFRYNLGHFAGVDRMDKLLNLRSLRTPRTMLKIVYKYKRTLDILVNNPDANDLKEKLGGGYPFWALFLIAMYYRLDPNDMADFIRGRGNIFKLMNDRETVEEKDWSEDPASPMYEFCRFACDFNKTDNTRLTLPDTQHLQKLAAIIRENTFTL